MGRTHRKLSARAGQYVYRLDGDPRDARVVLAAAELRLVARLRHAAPRSQQVAAAERVRTAQLTLVKALMRMVEHPTDIPGLDLGPRKAALAVEEATWRSLAVDEILARYAPRRAPS